MTDRDWHQLRTWLIRVFGQHEGAAQYAEHIAAARAAGQAVPFDERAS